MEMEGGATKRLKNQYSPFISIKREPKKKPHQRSMARRADTRVYSCKEKERYMYKYVRVYIRLRRRRMRQHFRVIWRARVCMYVGIYKATKTRKTDQYYVYFFTRLQSRIFGIAMLAVVLAAAAATSVANESAVSTRERLCLQTR